MDPMNATTYLAPLRRAVLFLIGQRRGGVSPETVAEVAGVRPDRARAYLSILVARRALVEIGGLWFEGPQWAGWASRPSRARPHRTTDQEALAEMDRIREAIARNVLARMAERGWTMHELRRRSGIRQHRSLVLLRQRHVTPPACQLVLIARALETTVDELAGVRCSDAVPVGAR